ncbi:MAG: helix-turn-helix transcriptional regulator [Thermomicrobiales bacterium]
MHRTPRLTATNLRTELEAQGRMQYWLARQIGITQGNMSKIVLGKRTVGPERAGHIARLLDVRVETIFEVQKPS